MAKILMCALMIFAFLTTNGNTQTFAKPKSLSAQEEREWVNAVRTHKTDDGATVLEVLRFVQHMRPNEFKFGEIGVGYNGATGIPDAVGIEYWLGLKRLPDDAYVNLGYDVQKTKAGFKVDAGGLPFSQALQKGRDAFLEAVDEEYAGECIDPETKRHTC